MDVVICDYSFWLLVTSLIFAFLSLLAVGNRPISVLLLAFSIIIQGGVLFNPGCASIHDLRKTPIVNEPAH
jgi:hypothetical protein